MRRLVARIPSFRRQDGISLVMAIGILGVLSLSGATLIHYAAANGRTAQYSKRDATAYDIAEAGIDEMAAILWRKENNPQNPYLLGAQPDGSVVKKTTAYDGGTATWYGTLNQSSLPATWTITSVGMVKNPTGPGAADISRTLTAKVRVMPRTTQPLANDVWNYFYVYGTGDPSGCDYLQANNSGMASPLYVAGNACFENQAWISEGDVQIHGTVTFRSPQNKIGESSARPITKAVNIKGGCKKFGATSFHLPCDAADNVYANPAPGTGPITLPPPAPAWETWYLNASPGPYYPCVTTAGTPPNGNWSTLFDTDQGSAASPDVSRANRSAGTVALTPSASYSCKTPAGELSWNASTSDSSTFGPAKTLTLSGTVFIDGNARIDSGSYVKTRGMGSLFLSGSFVFKNTNVCAVVSGTSCYWTLNQPGSWNPNQSFFEIVAGWKGGGGQTDIPSPDIAVEFISSEFQGGLQSADRVDIATTSSTQGPLVMRKVTLGQTLTTYPFPRLETVPVATPGNDPAYSVPQGIEEFSG